MNVRLSYGVELEEVPAKVAEMLQAPEKILINNSHKIDLITDLLHEGNGKFAGTVAEMIDDLRQELATMDQQLMEAHQIISGYAGAIAPPLPPPVQQPTQEPEPEPVVSKRLSDIPRGHDAVRYAEPAPPVPASAAGELPTLENNDV